MFFNKKNPGKMPGFFYVVKFLSNNQLSYTSCFPCVFDLINARLSGVLAAKNEERIGKNNLFVNQF